MVERLKAAIEKARTERERVEREPAGAGPGSAAGPASGAADPVARTGGALADLPEISVPPATAGDSRLVALDRRAPANAAFDLLRTRLAGVCAANNWRRIGVTSPTKGCGKSTVTMNLAFSFARQPGVTVALLDLDLKAPTLAAMLGQAGAPRPIAPLLEGRVAPAGHLVRLGDQLAVGLNTQPVRDSAELLAAPGTARAIAAVETALAPHVTLLDLPPMLVSDDVLTMRDRIDAFVLVVGAGISKARDIEACERLLEGSTLLGVVLNKCVDDLGAGYGEAYYAA